MSQRGDGPKQVRRTGSSVTDEGSREQDGEQPEIDSPGEPSEKEEASKPAWKKALEPVVWSGKAAALTTYALGKFGLNVTKELVIIGAKSAGSAADQVYAPIVGARPWLEDLLSWVKKPKGKDNGDKDREDGSDDPESLDSAKEKEEADKKEAAVRAANQSTNAS